MRTWFAARGAKRLIGVVHLSATPGAPRFDGDIAGLLARAAADARALAGGGCDALIVENFGDVPFHPRRVPPESVAALTLALERVAEAAPGLPLGVNVLRNDARAGLGLCALGLAAFVRVNVHVGAAVADQGLLVGRAHATLRARARLCPSAALWCDVHVKHAVPLSGGSLEDAARDTLERGLADALIVSGARTGLAPDARDLERVREAVGSAAPLLVGSGLDARNARASAALADGAIVGTALKRDGRVEAPVDEARVAAVRAALDAI